MPYRMAYVEPELFVEHNDVRVYRAYKDDEAARPLFWHFALYPEGTGADCGRIEFDVRNLMKQESAATTDDGFRIVLRNAIDAGVIKADSIDPKVGARNIEGASTA